MSHNVGHAEERLRLVINEITVQLPAVNRPLSVELRLINFCSCDFDSQEEHDTSSSCHLLAKRSDFPSAKGLVRCSPFGGGQIRQWIKATVGRSLTQKPQIQPLKLHQSAVTCDGDGFRAAENVQLREDVAQVPFHRGLADEEVRADFLVALAMREGSADLEK